MNFLHFKSFMLTADHKSITAAAKALYITPASLMQQLNLLEDELGFKVFARSHKGVVLTRAGEKLYQGCSDLISASDALFKECKTLAEIDESLIRISISRPYHLLKISEAYSKHNHFARLEFDRIDPLTQSNIENHFHNGGFDMIQLCYDPYDSTPRPYEIIPYPADRLCCVCSSDHPLSKKDAVALEELESCSLETFSNSSFPINTLQRVIQDNNLNIPIKRSLFTERSVLKCCANGNVYILEEQAARTFSYLSIIPISPAISCHMGLAYMKNAKPAVQHFAQYVREHMDVIAAQYE